MSKQLGKDTNVPTKTQDSSPVKEEQSDTLQGDTCNCLRCREHESGKQYWPNWTAIITQERQQAAEEATRKERERCLDKMFLEIAKLAEPDDRQPSAGDLHTNMDEIHKIRSKIKNG